MSLWKEDFGAQTHTQGEGMLRMEAEISVTHLLAKEPQILSAQTLGRGVEPAPPPRLRMNQAANTLISNFWPPEL